MFISTAYAQSAGGGAGGDFLGMMFPLIMIFAIFYFLMIRPQKKKQDEHRAMVEALRRGDTVITSGGLIGKVSKVVEDNEILVEFAENVKIRMLRVYVQQVRAKGEPVKDDGKK